MMESGRQERRGIAIMQPYFFPYIGYWQLISLSKIFVLYNDVNYIKKGWINRNYVLINGDKCLFNIPVINASQNRLICNHQIVQEVSWKKKLLRKIELSYSKAPYFSRTMPLVEQVVCNNETNLAEYIFYSIETISKFLSLDCKFVRSESFGNENLSGYERILDICRKSGEYRYTNPIGGRHLYSGDKFISEGVEIQFLEAKDISYRQFSGAFVPNLSILDVMMFNSKDQLRSLLSQYEVKR